MAKAAVIAAKHGNEPNRMPDVGMPAGGAGTRDDFDQVAVARRIEEALRARLGADRYAVWFGDAVAIVAEPEAGASGTAAAGGCIALVVGSEFPQEWLKRTFRSDVDAVVRAVCGGAWSVVWRTGPATGPTALAVRPAVQGLVSAPVEPPRQPTCQPAHQPTQQGAGVAGALGVRRQAASLDAFVAGPSNRMAFAAVELAASRPGEMSPLVLHGPSGVGKSHLLEGICGRFRDLHPGATTLLLSAEQFTTSFLQSLHGSGLPGFRRTCRNADLLVIDDLQFFAGKRATLMEVQQTVDALHRQGRQMVFASDRDLPALDGLGPDLLARLRGGMTARIESPDYDVRRGIVAAVAAKRGLPLPDEVVHYVATHMTRHARELQGAVNRLEATSLMLGCPVTTDMAEESLADLVRSSARSVRLADIERAVCSAFGLESGCLQSARRARTVNHPRMLAMFLARRHTTSALTEIGSYFGRRSHSTVISAQKAVGEWVAQRSRIVLADASWDVEEAIRRVEDVLRAG